jgi:hypothetical protein
MFTMKPKMDALTQEFDNIIERVSEQVDDKELAERERKADEFIESVRARHGEEMTDEVTPTVTCYRCKLPIEPKDLLNLKMYVAGEPISLHRQCPSYPKRKEESMNYNNFELEIIVRKLAEYDPLVGRLCSFCRGLDLHETLCPWQMAYAWALSHKPTPTQKCYRCRLSIGPKELMDRYMIRGEEVCVHRICNATLPDAR